MFGRSTSNLGADLGAGGIKLVELKLEKKHPVLFTYGLTAEAQDVHGLAMGAMGRGDALTKSISSVEKPLGEQPLAKTDSSPFSDNEAKKYAVTLKEVCRQARVIAKTAVVSLPVSAVFHSIVTLPLVKKAEFDLLLRAEVMKLLPYDLAEASLDYQVLPSPPEEKIQRVLVNAVPRRLVDFYTKIFTLADIKLLALEPESLALSRSLVGRDRAVTMIIDIGAERTNVFIIEETIPVTHQSLELGGQRLTKIIAAQLGVEVEVVEQIKHDLFGGGAAVPGRAALPREKFLELFNGVIDPIIKEVSYSFEVYFGQSGNQNKRAEKIILTGGGSQMPYLAEALAEKFKLRCFLGDPWGRVVYPEQLRPALQAVAPRMSVAIGLALRGMV